ncbi:MAG: aquaporin family protein [Merismopedia sp. SIO2A8]|nr:aquaporin family protein [Symploca sp. SIO2B6]NET50922.1 aquaporin family protein [Merismopedia sp. SIO2A8]
MLNVLRHHWPEYLIEAWGLGTFMVSAGLVATLLYAPTSPIVSMIASPWARGIIMGVAMGLTAIALIYSPWGKRSGAHFNPAVTLTFFRLKKIEVWDALFYVVAQFMGGVLGIAFVSLLIKTPFTEPPVNYIATVPGQWGVAIALFTEFFLSFTLMGMVLVTSNRLNLAPFTGVFAGILVAIFIIIAAPISGMSINPARTFASALPSDVWTAFWIYYFAPPLAMLTVAELYLRLSKLTTRSICCKLCPNGDQPCISIDCCGKCDYIVREWHFSDEPSSQPIER